MPRSDRTVDKLQRSCAGPVLRIINESQAGDQLTMLRVRGAADTAGSQILDRFLVAQLPEAGRSVVVDLTGVTVMSGRCAPVLAGHASRLRLAGRRLLVVAPAPPVQRALLAAAPGALSVYRSVSSAIAASMMSVRPTASMPAPTQFADVAACASLARVVEVLQERYCLPDAESAFVLLRDAAEKHHMSVPSLAGPVLAMSPPSDGGPCFPQRRRLPAPSLTYCVPKREHKTNRSAVLDSFLDVALSYLGSRMGYVGLVDGPDGALRLEWQRGLSPDSGTGAPAVAALKRNARVITSDQTSMSPAIRAAGIRSVQSTPLRTSTGECVGVVSTFHPQSDLRLTALQYARLDHAATETADWLAWHRRTIVLDALEYLHLKAGERVD